MPRAASSFRLRRGHPKVLSEACTIFDPRCTL